MSGFGFDTSGEFAIADFGLELVEAVTPAKRVIVLRGLRTGHARRSEIHSNAITNKVYTSAFSRCVSGKGIPLPPGFTWRVKQHFDVAIGNHLAAVNLS